MSISVSVYDKRLFSSISTPDSEDTREHIITFHYDP